MSGIVIVGGGQAGASLAFKLRALGHDGPVTLVGEEPEPPYQRPPLSKAYLLGEMTRERLYLRPETAYAEKEITLRTGARVSAIDTGARTVSLGGETLGYDHLALTTGSRPRRLPAAIGGDLGGVYTVRTLADIDTMAGEFREGARLLIVGGGYIGLDVTLVEAADRILQRVAAPETSDWFRDLHRAHGVDIREGVGLARLTGEDRVTGAELSNGEALAVDFVIVGVGIAPETALAETAGIVCDNGIAVDAYGRTSAPGVWAAGDCAAFEYRNLGRIRLESVQNAIDQSETVAANIAGQEQPYDPSPWFWSDQYDVKLQIAGLSAGYDRLVVREGGAARSHWYYEGDTLRALDAMNDSRAYMVGKRLIEAGKSPDPAVSADASADLKPILKA